MHAYVTKPDGTFYQSMVFGYDFFDFSHRALRKRYYLVLNEEKTRLATW